MPVRENLADRHIVRKGGYYVIHTYDPEDVVLRYPAVEYGRHHGVPFVLLAKSMIAELPVQAYYYF